MWESAVIESLCALTKRVLAALEAPVRHEVATRCFLRGYYGELLHPPLVVALQKQTAGAIATVDIRACRMKCNPKAPARAWSNQEIVHPPASTDVVLGLQKLCSSVANAQKFFASVEPPTLRFNRTILILGMDSFPGPFEDQFKECALSWVTTSLTVAA